MFKYFKKVLDNNIYKVDLIIPGEDEIFLSDLSRVENIANMQGVTVEEIFVQRTLSSNYVREIITGMFIPVRREVIHCELYRDRYEANNKITSPVFVRIINDHYYGTVCFYRKKFQMEKDVCIADYLQLNNYFEKHQDIGNWRSELENIFKEGERRYEEALAKNLVSDNTKTAHLVKKLKRDNWK